MNINFGGLNIPGLMNIGMIWIISFWILTAIVHLTFAAAVFKDAQRIRNRLFVLPGVWYIATLLGGVFVAAVYWVMHHSSLNPSNTNTNTTTETDNNTIL